MQHINYNKSTSQHTNHPLFPRLSQNLYSRVLKITKFFNNLGSMTINNLYQVIKEKLIVIHIQQLIFKDLEKVKAINADF